PQRGIRLSSGSSSEGGTEASVLQRIKDKHVTVVMAITFLLYSTVSTVIFQTFSCDDLEDVGQSYLRADYTISCGTKRHKAHIIYAAFMVLVYPVGIPVMYAIVLYRRRRLINPKETQEEGQPQHNRLHDRRIAQTSFLWK
ncbi:unnamed protein product, partial [Choristocarpus tenellus]